MSVVNDVLKNLDQQRSLEANKKTAPFFIEEKSSNKGLWIALVLSVALSTILTVVLLQKNLIFNTIYGDSDLIIPEDIFELSEPEGPNYDRVGVNNSASEVSNKGAGVDTENAGVKQVDTGSNLTVLINRSIASEQIQTPNKIVKKTEESRASESVVEAINTGDIEQAKEKLGLASKKIQDEVSLRLLMKNDPITVLPKIKSLYPQYSSQPRLLALAAQGEQRAGKHDSAIDLYKALIPLEPSDARWRSGLAISLESVGDTVSALRLYKLALSMNNLPYSLKRFSEGRIRSLSK